MKCKTYLILVVMVCVLSSGSYAALNDAANYFSFDDDDTSGNIAIDSAENNNGTIGGATTGVPGIINEAYDFDNVDDNVNVSRALNQAGSYTINAWVQPDADTGKIFAYSSNGLVMMIGTWAGKSAANKFSCVGYDTDYRSGDGTSTIGYGGEWHMVTCVVNTTANTIALYVNGSLEDSSAFNNFGEAQSVYSWGAKGTAEEFDGAIDEAGMWERVLSSAELLELYNSGNAYNPYASTSSTPAVTLILPDDNEINNSNNIQFQYNYTNIVSAQCSLYTNETGSWAVEETDTNPTENTTQLFLHNFTSSGDYLWDVICNDTSASANRTYIYDIVSPTISTDLPADMFAFGSYLNGNGNISGVINVSDDNLYSINISTDVEDIYYNISYSGNSLNYNLSHDVSGYAPGPHTLTVTTADGHTATKISDYKYSKGLNSIKFDFGKENLLLKRDYVEINVDGLSGSLDVKKEYDRYTFEYKKSKVFNSVTFYVKSDHYIDIVHQKYGYNGHLVIPDLNKWIDFEPESLSGKEEYVLTRLSPTKIKVTVRGLKSAKNVKFKSIGDLNVNTLTRTFYVINATETYSSPTLDGSSNTFALNFDANQSYAITAFLWYNNTKYTAIKTTNDTNQIFTKSVSAPTLTKSQSNISFHWNYTIVASASYSNTTSDINQTVDRLLLDTCGTYSTVVYNFTILDEESFTRIMANTTIFIDYTYNGINNNLSTSITNQNNFSICMQPNYANISTTNFDLQYFAGSNVRDWIRDNLTINNVTSYENLYLLTSTPTEITIHVIDETDVDLQGIVVEAHRWNSSTSDYYLVETELTDSTGIAVLDLSAGNAYYQFKLYQSGVLKLETEKFKLFATSYEYIIGDVSETPVVGWLLARSITSNLYFDNSTKVFTYLWADAGGVASRYCLNITYDNRTTLSYQCSVINTANLTYTITNTNASYIAQGIARISGIDRILETLSVNLKGIWRNIGQNLSIFLSLIFLIVFTLMGLASPKITILMASFSFIGLYFLGLIPLGVVGVMSIVLIGFILIMIMRERLTT